MKITKWVIIATASFAIIYDLFAIIMWGSDATISKWVQFNAPRHPFIPLFCGTLMTHLFVYRRIKRPWVRWSLFGLMIVFGLGVLIAGLLGSFEQQSALIWLAAGIPTGYILFPQDPIS